MQDPIGGLFRVYWGFTARWRSSTQILYTLTDPFWWEQGRWARALEATWAGDRAGSWVLGGSDMGLT